MNTRRKKIDNSEKVSVFFVINNYEIIITELTVPFGALQFVAMSHTHDRNALSGIGLRSFRSIQH